MFVFVLLALCVSDRWGWMPILHTSLTSNRTQCYGKVYIFLLQKCFSKSCLNKLAVQLKCVQHCRESVEGEALDFMKLFSRCNSNVTYVQMQFTVHCQILQQAAWRVKSLFHNRRHQSQLIFPLFIRTGLLNTNTKELSFWFCKRTVTVLWWPNAEMLLHISLHCLFS